MIPLGTEEWRTVVVNGETYDDYEVSNLGRVKSLRFNIIMKFWENQGGYYNVDLYKNKKKKSYGVHRLVAFAFIPQVEGKTEVNHINEDKHDNRVENLEWADRPQQIHHGTRTKRAVNKQTKTMRNRCGRKIRAIHVETGETIDFDSLTQASQYFKINKGDISRILKGEKYSRKGYTFIELGI